MKSDLSLARKNEAGFGLMKALLFIVLVALIVAAFMKLLSVWIAVAAFIVAAIVLGILANLSDIFRYMKISSM